MRLLAVLPITLLIAGCATPDRTDEVLGALEAIDGRLAAIEAAQKELGERVPEPTVSLPPWILTEPFVHPASEITIPIIWGTPASDTVPVILPEGFDCVMPLPEPAPVRIRPIPRVGGVR